MQSYIYDYSTKELVEELATRTGVVEMTVAPYAEYEINIEKDWEGNKDVSISEGSAIVLVVID